MTQMDAEILEILNNVTGAPALTSPTSADPPPCATSTPTAAAGGKVKKRTTRSASKTTRTSAKKVPTPYTVDKNLKRRRRDSAIAASASPTLPMATQLTTQLSIEQPPPPGAAPAMASSGNDGARPKSMFEQFKEYMDGQFVDLKKEIKTEVTVSVTKLTDQVNANSASIKRIETELSTALDSRVAEVVSRELKKSNPLSARLPHDPTLSRGTGPEAAGYWRARRAIRCWPITCTDSNLWGTVGDFFHLTLQIPTSKLQQTSVETIRRVHSKRREDQRIKDEVIVTFCDVATRDLVYSYANSLARFRGEQSPPGIRIEIPEHLSGVFKVLHEYGSMLRRSLGEGFKRNVRFDDQKLSLYIDVLIPGDTLWTRIDFDVAAEEVEKRRKSAAAGARERLSSLSSQSSTSSSAPRPVSQDARLAIQLPRSDTLMLHSGIDKAPQRWTGNP